ncbi:MAG: hypothetical protein OQL19_10260 [Gammaproteobacteria bacterium]|nr:hypothetical protein [Gammaproteobacteria bacterium]
MTDQLEFVPEDILCGIDDALDVDDQVQQIMMFDELIEKLKNLKNVKDEAAYLIGYLYYLHPKKKKFANIRKEVLHYLMYAIEITKNSSVKAKAMLYLGHQAFDERDYTSASKWFNSLNPEDLLSDYLYLKTFEMRLCCSIFLVGLSESLNEFDEFVNRVKSFSVADEDLWPQTLDYTLRTICKSNNLSSVEIFHLKKIAKKLDDYGNLGHCFVEIVEERN